MPWDIRARHFRYPNHFLARARQDFPANLGAGPHFDSDLNPSNKFIARQPGLLHWAFRSSILIEYIVATMTLSLVLPLISFAGRALKESV